MERFVPEVVSIADACLGGLRGRSALLIGPEERRQPYKLLLQQAGMKYIYQEETHHQVSAILPHVQLLMNLPAPFDPSDTPPLLTASAIAQGLYSITEICNKVHTHCCDKIVRCT